MLETMHRDTNANLYPMHRANREIFPSLLFIYIYIYIYIYMYIYMFDMDPAFRILWEDHSTIYNNNIYLKMYFIWMITYTKILNK